MSTVQTPWERGTERRIKAASLMFGDSHINTLDTHGLHHGPWLCARVTSCLETLLDWKNSLIFSISSTPRYGSRTRRRNSDSLTVAGLCLRARGQTHQQTKVPNVFHFLCLSVVLC